LGRFQTFATQNGIRQIEDVTPTLIRLYLTGLQERGLSTASVHTAATAVRALFNFCVADGFIDVSPMRRVKMPKRDKPQPIALTTEQVGKLFDACKCQRDRAILLCLLDLGCRAGEFLALRVGDVNLRTGTVAITHTKNREGRIGFLGYQARRALLTYLAERDHIAPDDPLWLTVKARGGTPLTYHGLKQVFRLLSQATGVKMTLHTMRKTFCTWLLRGGANLFEVQKLAGHSDLQVLRHYAAVTQEDLQEAHRRVGLADSLALNQQTRKRKRNNRRAAK